jgi:hypothetical protein
MQNAVIEPSIGAFCIQTAQTRLLGNDVRRDHADEQVAGSSVQFGEAVGFVNAQVAGPDPPGPRQQRRGVAAEFGLAFDDHEREGWLVVVHAPRRMRCPGRRPVERAGPRCCRW